MTRDMFKLFRDAFGCFLILAVSSSCSKSSEQSAVESQKGDLTRPQAMQLLNEYLAKPHADIVMMNSGYSQAVRDGVFLVNQPDYGPGLYHGGGGYSLGPKALPVIDRARQHWVDSTNNSDMVLCLNTPVAESVTKISGISLDKDPIVEFETAYILPPDLKFLAPYCYSGRKVKALFRKFDDGWHVSSSGEIPLPDAGARFVPGM